MTFGDCLEKQCLLGLHEHPLVTLDEHKCDPKWLLLILIYA